jgi:diguanylate cyclase (GGDEF)-like protein
MKLRGLVRWPGLLLPAIGIVFLLGTLGLFLGQSVSWELVDPREGGGAARLIFLTLFLTTSTATATRFAFQRGGGWQDVPLLAVLAVGANFVVQLSGGLHSPWQSLYLILIGFVVVAYLPKITATLVVGILALETSNWIMSGLEATPALVRLTGILIAGAAGMTFLEQVKQKRSERMEGELRKLNRGLQELSDSEEGESTSPLSEEGKRLALVDLLRGLDSRLGALLELVRDVTDAHGAFLLRADPGTTGFIVRLAAGAAGQVAEAVGARVSLVGGLFGDVLKDDKVLAVTEGSRPLPHFPWYSQKDGRAKHPELHSLLAVPFRDQGGPQWILVLDHARPDHFDEARQKLAEAFAEQMRHWVSSTRLLSELDVLSNEFRRLYQASAALSQGLRVEETLEQIVSFCSEITQFETCAICLLEEGSDTFSVPVAEGYPERTRGARLPLDGRTWAGWILRAQEDPQTIRFQLRTGMPVLHPGERIPMGAGFLGMPLLAKKRVVGVLLLTRQERPFSSNEVRLVRILCNQASIAVENARVYGAVEQMAVTDGLTGLYNRRYFQQALERELSRADRGGGSLALLLLDIDDFKALNDTYGHAIGDAVLKKIATVLHETLRKGDVLARYGGEEFVVLLPQATYEGAQEFAQRVWKAVGTAKIHPAGRGHRVTVSVGWALLPGDADSAESLVEAADRALYFAKESGRDKVADYHSLQSVKT